MGSLAGESGSSRSGRAKSAAVFVEPDLFAVCDRYARHLPDAATYPAFDVSVRCAHTPSSAAHRRLCVALTRHLPPTVDTPVSRCRLAVGARRAPHGASATRHFIPRRVCVARVLCACARVALTRHNYISHLPPTAVFHRPPTLLCRGCVRYASSTVIFRLHRYLHVSGEALRLCACVRAARSSQPTIIYPPRLPDGDLTIAV